MIPQELKITDHKNVYFMQFDDSGERVERTCFVESTPHLVAHWSPENPYVLDADSSRADALNDCIILFHDARVTMMKEAAPANVTLPGGSPGVLTKKKFDPERIVFDMPIASKIPSFLVDFQCDGKPIQYRFEIKDDGPLVGVQWEHQFWLDMGGDLELAHPLLKSILSFYELCK